MRIGVPVDVRAHLSLVRDEDERTCQTELSATWQHGDPQISTCL